MGLYFIIKCKSRRNATDSYCRTKCLRNGRIRNKKEIFKRNIKFVRYFTITLFALAAIVWAVQAVNFLDLVTEDGHAFSIYFLYSILTLSKVFTKLIPFSFMIATVLTILKLEKYPPHKWYYLYFFKFVYTKRLIINGKV